MWRQKEKNRILLNLLMAQVRNTSGEKGEEIFRTLEQQAQHLGVSALLKNTPAKLGIVTLEQEKKPKDPRAA